MPEGFDSYEITLMGRLEAQRTGMKQDLVKYPRLSQMGIQQPYETMVTHVFQCW